MRGPQDHIADIVLELRRLQRLPFGHRDDDDPFMLPRMIAAGDGSIMVSRKIDESIVAVADTLMAANQSLATTHTRAEWRAYVRRSFGDALLGVELDDDPSESAEVIFPRVEATLRQITSGYGPREFAFGCSLFSNKEIQAFQIGPVRFESKMEWLNRKCADGSVDTVTHRRVQRAWDGKRLRKRKASFQSAIETDIIESVGSGDFVCSVSTQGLAAEAAQERALVIARLAMTSVALLWEIPSKVLAGLNLTFDRRMHRQTAMSFTPGKITLSGSKLSHLPHGPWLGTGELEKELENHADFFEVVGEVLSFSIDTTLASSRPRIMSTLEQALLWFHEGCRENNKLMGIVKFSAVLDALACGRKASGIRRLINARLGLSDGAPIRPDGPTLRESIDLIYSDGRSRTVHGTNDKLRYDWAGTYGLAEQFARLCLTQCISWVAEHPSANDPLEFSSS